MSASVKLLTYLFCRSVQIRTVTKSFGDSYAAVNTTDLFSSLPICYWAYDLVVRGVCTTPEPVLHLSGYDATLMLERIPGFEPGLQPWQGHVLTVKHHIRFVTLSFHQESNLGLSVISRLH